MRALLKNILSRVPYGYFERILDLSVLRNKYASLIAVEAFDGRENLWKSLLDKYDNKQITLLEFGVFEGYSIKKFAEFNLNKDSCFVGFDSFEGLPEDWIGNHKKGAFDVRGTLPKTDDARISFVKGWFQNTLPKFMLNFKVGKRLIIHYDADIYSATLFVLMQIDALKIPYDAIFDEFTGQEARATYNYQEIIGAAVEFIGKTIYYPTGDPMQVACRITPCAEYRTDT